MPTIRRNAIRRACSNEHLFIIYDLRVIETRILFFIHAYDHLDQATSASNQDPNIYHAAVQFLFFKNISQL